MAKVKDKHSKKRATKLKEKRLSKMKGKGRTRRPSSVKSSDPKPTSQKHERRSAVIDPIVAAEAEARRAQDALDVAKGLLSEYVVANARTRSKDVKDLNDRARKFIDPSAAADA